MKTVGYGAKVGKNDWRGAVAMECRTRVSDAKGVRFVPFAQIAPGIGAGFWRLNGLFRRALGTVFQAIQVAATSEEYFR